MDETGSAPLAFGDAELFRLTRDTTWWCEPVAQDWNDIRAHLLMLYSLAKHINWPDPREPRPIRPPLCVEIGTRHGISTLALLMAMRETGGKLLSVEIDEYWAGVARERIQAADLTQWWTMNIANSDDFAADCPEGIDLLWIDGDHSLQQVTKDLRNYAPKVRKGGLICMHDYFDDIAATHPGEVATALSSALVSEEWAQPRGSLQVLTLPYSYGFTIIQKTWFSKGPDAIR